VSFSRGYLPRHRDRQPQVGRMFEEDPLRETPTRVIVRCNLPSALAGQAAGLIQYPQENPPLTVPMLRASFGCMTRDRITRAAFTGFARRQETPLRNRLVAEARDECGGCSAEEKTTARESAGVI
jgi:hypothetical protein